MLKFKHLNFKNLTDEILNFIFTRKILNLTVFYGNTIKCIVKVFKILVIFTKIWLLSHIFWMF